MFLLPWFLWFSFPFCSGFAFLFSVHDLFWTSVLFCQALWGMTQWQRYSVAKVLFLFWLMTSLNLTQSASPLLPAFPDVGLWWCHARVCRILWDASVSWVFWRPLTGALFTRQSRDWLTGMWHSCAPALGAKYTLELFLKYRTFSHLTENMLHWPASWGGVGCPMPFVFWPLKKKKTNEQTSPQLCSADTLNPACPTSSSKQSCISRVCLLAVFFLFLAVSFILIWPCASATFCQSTVPHLAI